NHLEDKMINMEELWNRNMFDEIMDDLLNDVSEITKYFVTLRLALDNFKINFEGNSD
ncbi:hypothetical protein H4219_006068, partial [Mycoemilia scoparia]